MAVEVYVNVRVKEGEKRWPSAGLSQSAVPGGTRQTAEDIGRFVRYEFYLDVPALLQTGCCDGPSDGSV
ncbi:hypothetical protein EYF80_050089 [Liparis tanakae]|uniref:Uncharacterized protein n=1 Tax=Liparis tanakae TaxID=230148 RepID=A0A4Z2FFR7_9TELE|nr:hypothetical protein EYF80_050089 [Liparis tanakae]